MNNPLMYTDPSGYNWWKNIGSWCKENSQLIGAVTGIAVSIAVVAIVVASGGTATPLLLALAGSAGGFTSGCLSTGLAGGNGWQVIGNGLLQGAIGFAAGYIGGTIGKSAAQGAVHLSTQFLGGYSMQISSPLVNGAVMGAIGGAAGGGITGFAVGFGTGFIASGGDLGIAWKSGLNGGAQGVLIGGAIGFASGAYSSYKYCSDNNIDMWNGKSLGNPQQPTTFDHPDGWQESSTDKSGGTKYQDPNNTRGNNLRYMPGNPNSPQPEQQVPYVKYQYDGKYYDVNGNPVQGGGKTGDAHIPLDLFNLNKMPQ
jgi:hypothetical protein